MNRIELENLGRLKTVAELSFDGRTVKVSVLDTDDGEALLINSSQSVESVLLMSLLRRLDEAIAKAGGEL